MYDLNVFPELDPVNRVYFEQYVRCLDLKQVKYNTIRTKLWRIYPFLKWYQFQDAKTITQPVLEDYFIKRRTLVSPFTLQGDILEVKLFYRFLLPKKEKQLFKNITIKRPRRHLPVDQLITRDDISKIIDACEKPRDRALFMLMWDSGGRINELLSLNIGHVQFDRYGAIVIVHGKTGMRRLRLISSVPHLQTWINMHPLKKDSQAPLFVTTRCYGGSPRRLDMRTVENKLKHAAKAAQIKKPVHPHAVRHARLTDLARGNGSRPGLNEMELRLVAGWERNSAMPEVYVHLSGADVERKVLANAGIIEIETPQSEMKLEPIMCPRCKTMNAHYSTYCSYCSLVLTEKAALSIEESVEVAKGSDDYQELLQRLKADLGLSHT